MSTGRTRKTLKLPTSYSLAMSRQGDRLVAIGRNVVGADPVARSRLFSCHPLKHPASAAFSPDGQSVAVKSTTGHIVVLDSTSGEITLDFKNHRGGEGAGPSFSQCNRFLVDTSWGGEIIVRSIVEPTSEDRKKFPGEIITSAMTAADGQTWAFLHRPIATTRTDSPAPAYLTIWDWPLVAHRTLRPAIRMHCAAMSPDGTMLAISGENTLQFMKVSNGEILLSVPIKHCERIRWAPDGTRLALILPFDEKIELYAFPGGELVRTFALKFPSDACFANDMSYIVIGSWERGEVLPLDTV